MFSHPSLTIEDWAVGETYLDLNVLAQTESIFALSNGHIGMRGNLDEGEPSGLPGTYLNGVFELHPLPYAEAGYGYPEAGQTVVNVTDAKLIRLLVDDEPFDVRYGELNSHTRRLDLRRGCLSREVEWCSPASRRVKIRSLRLVSFVQRAIAAIRYEVEAVDEELQVVVQSELVANESMPHQEGEDPRVAEVLESPLECEESFGRDANAILLHRVKNSGLRVGVAMQNDVDAPPNTEVHTESIEDIARVTVVSRLGQGQKLVLTKFVAYGWSAGRSRSAVHDQVRGALLAAEHTGWDGLLDSQKEYLDEFWGSADVELDGDPEVQQAVRFSMYHVLQAGARAERRAIPAKGLTGSGYDGHAFWDTEVYVLQFLSLSLPQAVADALRWRLATLPAAKERAAQLGLGGAAFPWRTINGAECSAYWPAGTAAFHIGADIAHATIRYLRVTGDRDFDREVALELLAETARLWRSLGHYQPDGLFRIDGVTGPDEYSALGDNNLYTNLMAQLNLEAAADSATRHPDKAAELGIDEEEVAAWRVAAEKMLLPIDERLGVNPQDENFTEHQVWDFDGTAPDQYPLLLHFPYFDLYRKQVVKQADVVLAMHLRAESFSEEQKRKNFDYYEPLTVRDSSLSACSQAVLAAESGYLDLAYAYVTEAALMDLEDLEHNTRDGVHIAALAGAWVSLVEGLGGLRVLESGLSFRPRLPEALHGLRFRLLYLGRRIVVTVDNSSVLYELLEGDPITVTHYDVPVKLVSGAAKKQEIAPVTPGPAPSQPPGREPKRPG